MSGVSPIASRMFLQRMFGSGLSFPVG